MFFLDIDFKVKIGMDMYRGFITSGKVKISICFLFFVFMKMEMEMETRDVLTTTLWTSFTVILEGGGGLDICGFGNLRGD